MNSIFSSFDAFSAESMGLRFSAFGSVRSSIKDVSSNNINLMKSQDNPTKVSETNNVNQIKKQESSKPRFAVELDGLNCFETIVSY